MQKARRNIRIKWMLEDLIHDINGINNIGWQRNANRKVIDHFNRDRAGGHKHSDLKIRSVENIFTDEVGTVRRKSIKKANRKLQRSNRKVVIAEGLADYEYCNDFYYDAVQDMLDEMEREYQGLQIEEYLQLQDEQMRFEALYGMDDDDQFYDDILDLNETWRQQEEAWHQIEMGYYRDEY